MCDVYIHNDMAMQQSLRLIELITCVMSSHLKKKTAENCTRGKSTVFAQFALQTCLCATTGMLTTVDKLQLRQLHGTALSKPGTCRCTATGTQNLAKELSGRIFTFFCTVAHRTCLFDITAMSNSVDELRARHSQCHERTAGSCSARSQGRYRRGSRRSTPSRTLSTRP